MPEVRLNISNLKCAWHTELKNEFVTEKKLQDRATGSFLISLLKDDSLI